VEISAAAIRHNFEIFKNLVGCDVDVIPVIKSNAYGHGMVEVARIFSPLCRTLAVASGHEAIELYSAGIRSSILILSFVHPSEISRLANTNAILPVSTLSEARIINRIGKLSRNKIRIHLKVDTGTTRIGVLADQAINLAKAITRFDGINFIGVYSHFADAENIKIETTLRQFDLFKKAISGIKRHGVSLPLTHIACTAAALRLPPSHLKAVRLGIGLYGLWPAESIKQTYRSKFHLQPALSWHTKVIQIKRIPAGTSIGYGSSYTVNRKSTIAILPVGYWDGFDRKLSNNCDVLIGGRLCPVVGRICMNLTMVDVTKVPRVKVGDKVTLIGCQGYKQITVEDMAGRTGTIHYEIVTRINPLLPRIII
jgi:alanine racemase